MTGAFADTLLALERAHHLRLIWWGGSAVTLGVLLLLLVRIRPGTSSLLRHFALQNVLWGGVDLLIVFRALRGLALRDHAGAVALDRVLWLSVGLDAGYILVGSTLMLGGWLIGRRLGVVGAGLGIIVQGTALATLDLLLLSAVGSLL